MSRMSVRACSTYTFRGGQTARIQELMKHPAWSVRSVPDYDVALGLLSRSLRFDHSCHSVDIPNHSMFPPFEDVWVAGWGAVRPDGLVDTYPTMSMQSYYAHMIPQNSCSSITEKFGIQISENFMCVEQKGHRGPCTRDSGTPAVSDGVLWGLASWGIRKKCGTERYPAVFSYIGSPGNLYFITNATRMLQSDPRIYPFLDRLRSGDAVMSAKDFATTKPPDPVLKVQAKPQKKKPKAQPPKKQKQITKIPVVKIPARNDLEMD